MVGRGFDKGEGFVFERGVLCDGEIRGEDSRTVGVKRKDRDT